MLKAHCLLVLFPFALDGEGQLCSTSQNCSYLSESLKMRKSANSADAERHKNIGLKLRLARQAAGLSQTALGNTLGVSFQQVQKYERGTNRLSVEALERSCILLGITTASLLAEGPVEIATATLEEAGDFDEALRGEIVEIATAYARISTHALRRSVLGLVLSMSRADETA